MTRKNCGMTVGTLAVPESTPSVEVLALTGLGVGVDEGRMSSACIPPGKTALANCASMVCRGEAFSVVNNVIPRVEYHFCVYFPSAETTVSA